MASASSIPVTPGDGINLDTVQVTTAAGVVEREGVFIGDGTKGGNRANVTDDGAVQVDGSGVTQPVSGSVSVSNFTDNGLTDAQLRASDVPVADSVAGNFLWRILQMLLAPLGYDKSLQRYRQTAIIESGTVTTCATLTNQTNIGGFNADAQVRANINAAWALNVRARIT